MKANSTQKIILIGGSAGSFSLVLELLEQLPKGFPIPIVICMHRLKHVRTGFVETLSLISKNPVIEPFDHDKIEQGKIYVVPANYHLMINAQDKFSLSTEEAVNYSRPSIDVLFSSAARILKQNSIGIILSGANKDGAEGLAQIKRYGGVTIVQDPQEAQAPDMPQFAIALQKPDYIIKLASISAYINSLL